jgi:hypothetical protein
MVSPSSARMAFGIKLVGDTRIPSSLLPVHRRRSILYNGREITSIYLHDFDRISPFAISIAGPEKIYIWLQYSRNVPNYAVLAIDIQRLGWNRQRRHRFIEADR